MLRSSGHAEIDFTGHPFFVTLGQQGRNETKTGGGVREDRGDARASLDLTIDSFKTVSGARPYPMRLGRVKGSEAFGQIVFSPLRKLGHVGGPSLDGLRQEPFGFSPIRRIEDRANAQGDRLALIEAGNIGMRILLKVKLAALPRNTGQCRTTRCLE